VTVAQTLRGHMLDLLTAPQTLAALFAIAGATVFFVAWGCRRRD
jgi:hypothetical protein